MPYNAEQNQLDNQNQDPNQQNGQQQQSGQNLAGSGDTGTAGAAGSGRVAAFSSGSTPASNGGSGRYTNLQKYLGANQGATDHLYQGINRRIDQTTSGQKQEAQSQADKVKEGINQGSQALQRGTGYYNQMQDQNFNAQDFASDQNRLDDYGQFRTGSAVDVGGLNNQNNSAQTANIQAQDLYNNRLGQVGTENGRFDLLKETFGGRGNVRPTYSAGNQRLDQLFLQSGAGNKIGQLQNDLRGNVNQLNQGLNTLKGDVTNNITGLGAQQTDLSGNIQNEANRQETGYIDNIQNQVGGINTARDAERSRYNDFVQQLLNTGQGKETNQQLDSQIFNEALLNQGEQTFNFLKNPTLTSQQFQNIDTRNANDYRDIANQQNVDYYGALSKLAGINNSKLDKSGMLVDPATGQLVRAATIKTGDGSLRQGIDKAQQDFITKALNTTVTGEGRDSGTSSIFGGGSDAVAQLQVNLAKYLQSQGTMDPSSTYQNEGTPNWSNTLQQGTRDLSMSDQFNRRVMGQVPLIGGLLANSSPAALPQLIASGLASYGGTSSGSQGAANARAQSDLLNQINSLLGKQGFNNYLTTSGIKNTDDIANRTTAADIDSQEMDRRYADRNADTSKTNLDMANPYLSGNQQENDRYKKAYSSGILNSGYSAQDLENLRSTDFNKYLDISRKYGGEGATEARDLYYGADQFNNALVQGQQLAERNKANTQATYDQKMSEVNASKVKALDEMKARLGLSNMNLATVDPSQINVNQFDAGLNNQVGTGGDIKNSPSMSLDELRRRFAGK